jgi:hypothetical protein
VLGRLGKEPELQGSISRRRFLAGSVPALAVLLYGAPAWADSNRKAYYVLDPDWKSSRRCDVPERHKPDDCHACSACHAHAANKLFATRAAAEHGRAHPGCKCKVVRGGTFGLKLWADLFGGLSDPEHLVVDRRSKHAQAAFRRRARRARRRHDH